MNTLDKRHPIQVICDQAKLENTEQKKIRGRLNGQYLGDTREAKLIENIDFQPFFVKHIISLKDEPVSLENFTNYDDSVRTTAGFYTLTYVPTTDLRYVKNKPYVIGQDLIRMRVTVSGPKHWGCLSSRIPELGWIERWCPQIKDKSRALFGLAKRHPGMNFYFSPDWVAYARLIDEKAKAAGIDLDRRVFVTYKCTKERREQIESTHKMSAKKTKADYQSILDEVEHSNTVQEEIKEEKE